MTEMTTYYETWQVQKFGNVIGVNDGPDTVELELEADARKVDQLAELQLLNQQ